MKFKTEKLNKIFQKGMLISFFMIYPLSIITYFFPTVAYVLAANMYMLMLFGACTMTTASILMTRHLEGMLEAFSKTYGGKE
jgi:hypothetical protein